MYLEPCDTAFAGFLCMQMHSVSAGSGDNLPAVGCKDHACHSQQGDQGDNDKQGKSFCML